MTPEQCNPAVGQSSAREASCCTPAHTQRAADRFRSLLRDGEAASCGPHKPESRVQIPLSLPTDSSRAASESRLADSLLESAIIVATLRLQTAVAPSERREAWDELISLIAQRSADRVREMERARGLR